MQSGAGSDNVIEIIITGMGAYTIEHLILDLNGTVALDGTIIGGVTDKVTALAGSVDVTVVTADTHKNAEDLLKGLPVNLCTIHRAHEDEQKRDLVIKTGRHVTVSIGNGRNDVSMLRESAIGICVIGGEGASAEAVMASDVVVSSIHDALDLLLKPHRLKATLRR